VLEDARARMETAGDREAFEALAGRLFSASR
jgi:hypothetical protein